jgi:hypothetical protein
MARKMTGTQVREALREYMRQIAVEGGRKGGKARAKNMTAAKRSASARKAARARWRKAKKK